MTPSQKRIVEEISTWEDVTVESSVNEFGNVTAFVIPKSRGTIDDLVNRMACLHIGKRGSVHGTIDLLSGETINFDAKTLWKAHHHTGATCDPYP